MPFRTAVLGVDVTVDEIKLNAAGEIVAICSRGAHRQPIAIVDLPMSARVPEGAEWIDAYRRWRSWYDGRKGWPGGGRTRSGSRRRRTHGLMSAAATGCPPPRGNGQGARPEPQEAGIDRQPPPRVMEGATSRVHRGALRQAVREALSRAPSTRPERASAQAASATKGAGSRTFSCVRPRRPERTVLAFSIGRRRLCDCLQFVMFAAAQISLGRGTH
jgi:hypothetical protein